MDELMHSSARASLRGGGAGVECSSPGGMQRLLVRRRLFEDNKTANSVPSR